MKKYTLLIILLSPFYLYGMQLMPHEKTSIKEHLLEINSEWKLHFENLDNDITADISFRSDKERIQFHLEMVALLLKSKNKLGIHQDNRSKFILELSKYASAALFPCNNYHKKRQPYFVDNNNQACAVGHLLLVDGQNDLVDEIRTKNNFAYIKDLKDERIDNWAFANGFTIDELALIQPGYPSISFLYSQVGSGIGPDGIVKKMKTSNDGNMLYIVGDFTTFDGVVSPGAVAYDGEEFISMGEGIQGTVHDIAINYNDDIYIVGKFDLDGVPNVNIAKWNGTKWEALQSHNMEGTIYAVQANSSRIYVGGIFDQIDNISVSNLAYFNSNDGEWSTEGEWKVSDAFTVNGPVYDLESVNGRLLVAGAFTKTANLCNDTTINKINTRYLSYWTYSNWESSFSGEYAEVHHMFAKDGQLFIGGDLNEKNSLAILDTGFWTYYNSDQSIESFIPRGDGIIKGFVEIEGNLFAYGGFQYTPGIGNLTTNVLPLTYTEYGINRMDNTVTAAVKFQNDYYFAGDFTEIENESFSGFVRFNVKPSSNENIEKQEDHIQVYHANDNLYLKGEIEKNTQLCIYNLQGQLMLSSVLDQTDVQKYSTYDLESGNYFYTLISNEVQQSGKFVKLKI